MGMYATHRNHKGYEYVVRVVSAPSLEGKTASASKRKARGKAKADALEMTYANRIDRKVYRAQAQRDARRAKRK
jgi:hypothetical protein